MAKAQFELDSLRKDLSEKEELLIHSGRAVELLQLEHQDKIEQIRTELEREKSYLQDHIDNLQKALREKDRRLSTLDSNPSLHTIAFGCDRESIEQKEQASLRNELSNITKKYVKLEEDMDAVREDYMRLEERLDSSNRENVTLKAQVRALETELEKRQAHLKQAYLDLGRTNGSTSTLEDSQQDEQLTRKEEEMAELVKMINDIERNFETNVNSKQSSHSLSRSSSSNNSLSINGKDQLEASHSSILRNIFFRSNR
ncbi:paramyosin isoform X2 [Nilaparvata lugens]|uniref:paramyosin isoform X2 n=1 Tax=Nilaparvata lugens TaxID=108931 RepID=UPI00193D2370|nr:paramyosin isoform X2 [Nilaparvata lugens]